MDVERLKNEVCESVDALTEELLRISHEIHANPELAFEERHAVATLTEALVASGLDVDTGAYGLETAFATEFGQGEAGCVALLAEYDALPLIGHACGHNVIATASVGAGLALARLADRLPGRVRVLGTPAEEHGCGKELMAREGAFEGVDAAMMIHPAGVNLATMPCIAMAEVDVTFHGQSAHAAASPERGVNALDALVLAYQAIAQLRQHIRSGERVHGIITDGGQAPNIVPVRAAGRFYVRAPNFKKLAPLKERIEACFHAGAKATGADVDVQWGGADYRDIHYNDPLAKAFQANAEKLGREFFPFEKLPPSFSGSTDLGNVSYRVPSIHPMLASAPSHCIIHNPEFEKWAGSEMGDSAALDGAKALAMTVLDYLADADLRRRSHDFFDVQLPK
ncbi:MAG: M20 family metallopeptidase [Myxococcales bacterium]|nr:M20 family metallopeptidase [Myxococcales bacterium]